MYTRVASFNCVEARARGAVTKDKHYESMHDDGMCILVVSYMNSAATLPYKNTQPQQKNPKNKGAKALPTRQSKSRDGVATTHTFACTTSAQRLKFLHKC